MLIRPHCSPVQKLALPTRHSRSSFTPLFASKSQSGQGDGNTGARIDVNEGVEHVRINDSALFPTKLGDNYESALHIATPKETIFSRPNLPVKVSAFVQRLESDFVVTGARIAVIL